VFHKNTWKSYEGEFKNNKMEGKGTFLLTNGDKFNGDFCDNNPSGEGTFIINETGQLI
jgi:hypothetical protein